MIEVAAPEVDHRRVVIVHEWLTNLAGSEKVVDAMRQAFPGATVAAAVCDRRVFPDWDVVTTPLQWLAGTRPHAHVQLLPLIPAAWLATRLPPADVYILSLHTFTAFARIPRDRPHLVYCHTPPRFLASADLLEQERLPAWQRPLGRLRSSYGRVDRRRATRLTHWIANSRHIANRIEEFYGIPADVIHPPVDVERFAAAGAAGAAANGAEARGGPGDYFVAVSRLVPYKQIDLAVEAFRGVDARLVVVGHGREAERLRAIAPPNVEFRGHVADADLPGLIAGAQGFVFPGVEDFGITPVEAMAAGTPVIARRAGGVVETVVEGTSGVFFDEPSAGALRDALHEFQVRSWDRAAVAASVQRFSAERFRREVRAAVARVA
jgi:glycosyltransferase involved in cell wall biosynthesis